MEKSMATGSDLIMQSPTTIAPDSIISSSPTHIASFTSHPSQSDIMPLLPSPIDTTRRRRPSRGAASLPAIKRSASTPNVRALTAGETAMSLAEKRRNKLGYHRTSVACVHCRKRKIRCLLAPDDPQNRCSNCIRLKKECKFYPVDQQPPVDRRPRAGSSAEGLSAGNSTSSSSSPINGHAMDSGHQFNPYPMLPLATQTYSSSMTSLSGGIISPPSSIGPQSTRVLEFPSHHERSSWESQMVDHPPMSAGHPYSDDANGGLWKESPITPSYSPFTTGPPAALALQTRDFGTSYPPFVGQRHEPGWFPTRSMSYGHVEDLSHSYPTNYHHQFPIETRRRATVLHTPSLQTSNNSSNTSVSDMQGPPMSAPLSSSSMQQFALPPAWHSHPAPSPRTKLPEYGNWYPEPSQLANVQEEEVIPHFGREPAILYSSAGSR